jgi:hypothetical protein
MNYGVLLQLTIAEAEAVAVRAEDDAVRWLRRQLDELGRRMRRPW